MPATTGSILLLDMPFRRPGLPSDKKPPNAAAHANNLQQGGDMCGRAFPTSRKEVLKGRARDGQM